MAIEQPNQLYRKLLGINSLNPFDGHDSSSRKQMFATHLTQALVIEGSTERYIQTGMEKEYGKYTFSVKMPVDAEIIRVIDRYRPTMDANSINHVTHTVVIYEDEKTKEVGMVELPRYCSYHQHFGFPYKTTKATSSLRRGAFIPKGTILLDSPSVNENGGYQFGRECNVAFMTHPAVAEDGILISRDVLPNFKIKTYESRVVEYGNDFYPLNAYGTPSELKAFPNIGEYIRDDGLLMALRRYDDELAPVEQNIYDLMKIDFVSDKTIYGAGPGGRIIDIRVHHDNQNMNPPTPIGMEVQASIYDRGRRTFYNEILTEYNRLKRERGEGLRITPQFHRLVVEAMSVVGETEQRILRTNGKNPLDDWRIEFVIEYEIIPKDGFKLTDCHGGR